MSDTTTPLPGPSLADGPGVTIIPAGMDRELGPAFAAAAAMPPLRRPISHRPPARRLTPPKETTDDQPA